MRRWDRLLTYIWRSIGRGESARRRWSTPSRDLSGGAAVAEEASSTGVDRTDWRRSDHRLHRVGWDFRSKSTVHLTLSTMRGFSDFLVRWLSVEAKPSALDEGAEGLSL